MYLNGKPFYLRAALDQDYYPDTICTLPSVEFLEDRFNKAKQLGLNALRCHIKVPDPRYYEVADRLGLLIWAELPNAGDSTELSRERKELTLKGLIDRDGNHPSIFCWTLINENWGVDLVHDAYHRAWLKKLYLWLKSYDPSRLVVDNSPLAPSFHVQTDLADFHFYAAIPDSREDWDQFVEELAGRAEWLFSPEGDAVITGQEPLLCSEFGNWGLPDPEKLRDAAGAEAWWFETGHDWSEGVMYAHGVRNRFQDWSLDRVFGTFESFVEATQWQQFRALKYQIEAMRRRPQIAGYVITELTDCHWEANGLLDMRSNPRVFHNLFHSINADTVILPTLDRPAYWSGDAVRLSLCVAHGGPNPLEPAALDISLDRADDVGNPLHRARRGGRSRHDFAETPGGRALLPAPSHPALAFSRRTTSREQRNRHCRACEAATAGAFAVVVDTATFGTGCRRLAMDWRKGPRRRTSSSRRTLPTALAAYVRAGGPSGSLDRNARLAHAILSALAECQGGGARRHALARRLGVLLRLASTAGSVRRDSRRASARPGV